MKRRKENSLKSEIVIRWLWLVAHVVIQVAGICLRCTHVSFCLFLHSSVQLGVTSCVYLVSLKDTVSHECTMCVMLNRSLILQLPWNKFALSNECYSRIDCTIDRKW